MTDFKLEAKTIDEQSKQVRRNGLIPAIVYGNKFNNVKIAFDKIAFERLFKEAGTSNLVDLKIDGKSVKTLIHDVQIHPVTSDVIHVDFFKVNMKEKIHAEIPLEFVGESTAVIDLEGSLITSKDSIEVECLPSDLISEIKVDISVLDDFEKNIKISDLVVPEGIEILDEADEIVAFIQEPRSEEEMEELDSEVVADVSAIEVENKGEDAPKEEDSDKK